MSKEKNINQKQLEIVKDNSNFILVAAGAGTGKTTTIIEKVKYLVKELRINPNEIICVSFTNESTNELKNRIKKEISQNIDCLTFHQLGLNILKNKNYTIADNLLLDYIIEEYLESIIYNFPENIKRVLSYLKIKYNKNNYSHKYETLKSDEKKQIKSLVNKFINLLKTNNLQESDILTFIKKEKRKKHQGIMIIIYHIACIYKSELKSTNFIDFNDMINYSISYLKDYPFYKEIKYLIIDEFQDTSKSKFILINEIQKRTNCKIFAVGDDFQSIYRFTGCDLNIFLKFEDNFKNAKIYRLEKTYRNSNELVSLTNSFIMKNNKQLKKNLYSDKHLKKPIEIIYYKNLKKSVERTIKRIYNEFKKPILILGRNNFDINQIIDKNSFQIENEKIVLLENTNIKIRYLTVHKAKGLEEENVILINLLNNKNGFPNKKNSNHVLKHVTPDNNEIKYAEERRLFYVALTRTKNKNYIMTQKNNESVFVKELIKNHKKYITIKKE